MSAREPIACLGAGRMARGIAVVFAYAGHPVTIVDVKARDAAGFAQTAQQRLPRCAPRLPHWRGFGLFAPAAVDGIVGARLGAAGGGRGGGPARRGRRSSKACRR